MTPMPPTSGSVGFYPPKDFDKDWFMFFLSEKPTKIDLDANQDENLVASKKNTRYTSDLCVLSEKEIVPPWNPIFYGDWIPPESAPLHGFCGYDSVGHLRKKQKKLAENTKNVVEGISNLLLSVVTGSKWHPSVLKVFHIHPRWLPGCNFHQIDSGWGWFIT